MRTLFDAYIMVDWSAAAKPTTGANSIWLGLMIKDARLSLKFQAKNPSTRLEARQFLHDIVARLHARGDRVLVGFDFPLGYPAGTAAALGLKPNTAGSWAAIHGLLADKVKEKPDNTNARYALAASLNYTISGGPAPFWGTGSAKDVVSTLSKTKPDYNTVDLEEFRQCERLVKAQKRAQPSSPWKLAGVGVVGGQALLGIPTVHTLRTKLDNARVWPFETPESDESGKPIWGKDQLVMTEIYPSLNAIKASATETLDAKQVEFMCRYFADADKSGTLVDMLNAPSLIEDPTQKAAVFDEEGWILGVMP